ncbi:MAG: universal stress protein, partial [Pseudomonadota bacterium]
MQLSVKNILYSTDLSRNAPIAFGYATYLAKLTDANIHILHVLERLSDDAAFAIQVYVQDDKKRHDMLDLRIDRAKKLLDEKQDTFWAAHGSGGAHPWRPSPGMS